jgi:hypothetical protein
MNAWIFLWKIVLIVGIVLFTGTVVYIIPTGVKDIMRFFKSLGDPDE